MNCPHCDVEMAELSEAGLQVHACPECAGAYLEGAQLNALLLHANLPGVDSLGGREAPDGPPGTCPACRVDLAVFERRGTALFYEACEDCGFMFVPLEPPAAAVVEAARRRLAS